MIRPFQTAAAIGSLLLIATGAAASTAPEASTATATVARRVYASVLSEWMGIADTASLLRGDFARLGLLRGSGAPVR